MTNKQMMIIANKSDLDDDRVVGNDEIRQKAEEIDVPFFEVSAMDGSGLQEAFDSMIKRVVSNAYKGESKELKLDENNNSSGNCANNAS